MSGRQRGNPAVSSKPTKGQRKDTMARKREERAARATHKRQQQAQSYQSDEENFAAFATQLVKMGLELREIPGDGNCLFRALGDQLEGHSRTHLKHRRDVVKYMLDHKADFEPFVEDDVSFEKHTKNLNSLGTYAGNDAIVAFARLHELHVVIHQVNSPCWQIHGTDNPASTKQLHISYHNGDHYSSIRKLGDHGETPANIKMAIGSLTEQNGSIDSDKKPEQMDSYKPWETNGGGYYYDDRGYNGEYTEEYVDNLHLPEVSGENTGMAKAVRTEESTVETIMRLTGCEDEELVRQTLADVGYDMESATDIMMQLMSASQAPSNSTSPSSNGLWSESGTGSRIFGKQINGDVDRSQSSSGAKPKLKQQSVSMQQRTKKQDKKARAAERRRQERLGNTVPSCGGSSDEDYHVVADKMGTLKI